MQFYYGDEVQEADSTTRLPCFGLFLLLPQARLRVHNRIGDGDSLSQFFGVGGSMNTMTDGNLLLKSVPAFMQLESRFDTEYGVLWGLMDPLPRPCFNETLLEELHQFVQKIQDGHGSYSYEGKLHPLSYGVIASKTPGVFNLGGDLALFKKAILDRAWEKRQELQKRKMSNAVS